MRTNFTTNSGLMAMALVMGLNLNSCTDPKEGVDLILNAGITEATVGIEFVNAATGEPVGMGLGSDAQVIVSIQGANANSIVAVNGSTDYFTDQGFLALAVKNGVSVGESTPITFTVVANAPGYLSTGKQVTIYALGGTSVTIPMVEIANEPEGVEVNRSFFTTTSTGTTAPFTISSVYQTGFATVTIPSGTLMQNASGGLITGDVDVTLGYFNPTMAEAVAAYPGGFSANVSGFSDIAFATAGFVSLDMVKTGTSNVVKNFGGGSINMNVEVPDGVKKADGSPIAVGDIIPIWSYDTETGVWSNESGINAIAQTNGSGRIEVNFPVTHLSYWNLDFYNASCVLGATVNVGGNIPCYGYRWVQIKNNLTNIVIDQRYMEMTSGSSFRLAYPPQGVPLTVSVYESATSTANKIGEVIIGDCCSGAHDLTVNSSVDLHTVNITVNLRCPESPNFIFRPTLPLWARVAGGSWIYIGQMVDGSFSTCALVQGGTYDFATFYDGTFYTSPESFFINQTDYLFERTMNTDACNKF